MAESSGKSKMLRANYSSQGGHIPHLKQINEKNKALRSKGPCPVYSIMAHEAEKLMCPVLEALMGCFSAQQADVFCIHDCCGPELGYGCWGSSNKVANFFC